MDRRFSIYLDAVRFLAAMAVFASHFVYERWTGGLFPEVVARLTFNSGFDAVLVFFVLSGLVIAYTVDAKDKTWRQYAFNRATRIYSVAAPAIIVTIVLDQAGRSLDPTDYAEWWYADHSLLKTAFRGLTFSTEFWTWDYRMGSNGPYWSLGYEVWYYVLFGIVMFARGMARAVLFGGVMLLAGPRIWLLAPVWIMGAALYHHLQRHWRDRTVKPRTALAAGGAALIAVALYAGLRASSANEFLQGLSISLITPVYDAPLGFSNRFLWDWVVGALIVVHFYGAAIFLKRYGSVWLNIAEKPVRWLAGASFSIYLTHYPALHAFDAAMGGNTDDPLRALALFSATFGFCLVFAALFERPLRFIRASVRAIAGGKRRGSMRTDAASYRPRS